MKTINSVTIAENTMKTIDELRALRIELDKQVFQTANDVLYNLLGDVYELASKNYDNAAVRTRLKAFAEDKYKFSFRENKPSLFAILLKIVFADNDIPLRRISSYKRVLETIYSFDDVFSREQFVEKVNAFGGLEEVRKQLQPVSIQSSRSAFELATDYFSENSEELGKLKEDVLGSKLFDALMNSSENDEVVTLTLLRKDNEFFAVRGSMPVISSSDEVSGEKVKSLFMSLPPVKKQMKTIRQTAKAKAKAEKKLSSEDKVTLKYPMPRTEIEESTPYDNCMWMLDDALSDSEPELEAA